MLFTPKRVTVTETDPSATISYNVEIRDAADNVLATGSFPSAGTTTVLPIGDSGGPIQLASPSLAGQNVFTYVQQVGPSGDKSTFKVAKTAAGDGLLMVYPLPSGNESLLLTV